MRLQEVTVSSFGRRDIVIEAVGMRVVLEAKIGRVRADRGPIAEVRGRGQVVG